MTSPNRAEAGDAYPDAADSLRAEPFHAGNRDDFSSLDEDRELRHLDYHQPFAHPAKRTAAPTKAPHAVVVNGPAVPTYKSDPTASEPCRRVGPTA